mgnify:CR=1 FL=1
MIEHTETVTQGKSKLRVEQDRDNKEQVEEKRRKATSERKDEDRQEGGEKGRTTGTAMTETE